MKFKESYDEGFLAGSVSQACDSWTWGCELKPHDYLKNFWGASGWLSRLSGRLWLRSWSHDLWVWAPRQALCWQLGAWHLLQILCLPLFLSLPCSCSVSLSLSKMNKCGAPGWLSRLSGRLRLRSWSHGLWVRAPRRALCWQLRAWSLFRILCLPFSLLLPCSCSVSLSLSKINKH